MMMVRWLKAAFFQLQQADENDFLLTPFYSLDIQAVTPIKSSQMKVHYLHLILSLKQRPPKTEGRETSDIDRSSGNNETKAFENMGIY